MTSISDMKIAASPDHIEDVPRGDAHAGDAHAGDAHAGDARSPEAMLRARVEAVLCTVFDPEIPVNICELGLIYHLDVSDEGMVDIKMTLTAPNCPAAGMMPAEVEAKVRAVEGVTDVRVELVWEPPWDKSRMSEAARFELGFL